MRETCTHAEGRHACNIFDCPDNRRRWGNRESSCRSVAPEGHHWLRSCGILIRRNRIRRSCCRSSRWRIRSWWRANRLRAFPVPKWNLFQKNRNSFIWPPTKTRSITGEQGPGTDEAASERAALVLSRTIGIVETLIGARLREVGSGYGASSRTVVAVTFASVAVSSVTETCGQIFHLEFLKKWMEQILPKKLPFKQQLVYPLLQQDCACIGNDTLHV